MTLNARMMAAVALAVACGFATATAAQTRIDNFELEQLDWNPSTRDGFLVGGGDLLPAGEGRLSLFMSYQHNPLRYYEDRALRSVLVRHRWTATLSGAIALTKWLELGAVLPVVVYQNGDTVRSSLGEVVFEPIGRRASLGTTIVQARIGFLRESDGHPFDLALGVGVGLPTGQTRNLTKDLVVPVIPRLGIGKSIGRSVRLAAEVAAWIRPIQQSLLPAFDSGLADRMGSRMQAALAVSTLGEGLRAELSGRAFFPLTNVPNSFELMAGLRYPIEPVELFVIGGPGFGNSPSTPAFRTIVGLSFTGFKDRDSDKDGFFDKVDACVHEAGPGTRDGCPIRDADGDGVIDVDDACPTQPGPAIRKGCPVKDRDQDGIEDDQDRCPQDPGIAELQGCPDLDTDGDGIKDRHDKCPLEAGEASREGCPAPPAPAAPTMAVINGKQITLSGTVHFDPSKATIQERSHALLNDVATLMQQHPELTKVAVDGHTDSLGGLATNHRLSEARANAVRDYLIAKGVAADRLTSRGFGETKPVETNKTKQGREKNRRVEFWIMD